MIDLFERRYGIAAATGWSGISRSALASYRHRRQVEAGARDDENRLAFSALEIVRLRTVALLSPGVGVPLAAEIAEVVAQEAVRRVQNGDIGHTDLIVDIGSTARGLRGYWLRNGVQAEMFGHYPSDRQVHTAHMTVQASNIIDFVLDKTAVRAA